MVRKKVIEKTALRKTVTNKTAHCKTVTRKTAPCKTALCLLLAAGMVLGSFGTLAVTSGAKKAGLSFTNVKLKTGEKKKIVIKNRNKKAKYTYKSSSPKKIAVNKKGVITAKKKGKAKITVTEKIGKKTRRVGVIKVTCSKGKTDKTDSTGKSDGTGKTDGTGKSVETGKNVRETPVVSPGGQTTPQPADDHTAAPSQTPEITQEPAQTPTPTPDVYTKNVMSITVTDKDLYTVEGSTCTVDMQYFEGYVSGDYAEGNISGQGTVVYKEYKEDGRTDYCARYIVKGTDEENNSCNIFIEDNGIKNGSGALVGTPTILTDSKALAWLETADLQSRVTDNGNGEKVIDIMWNESNTEPKMPPAVKRPDESKQYTRELFTFLIDIGASEEVNGSTGNASMIHFGGRGECENFNGKIVADSVDTRMKFGNQVQSLSARYILTGTDANGNPCNVYVENNGIDDNGMVTEPTIITDCPDYAWIESAPLHGTVSWSPQLTIHMWTTED